MKRRILSFICIVAILLASTCTAFAAGLEVTAISPADGAKGKQPQNMAVKITFNDVMVVGADETVATNAGRFSIADTEGNLQKFTLVCSDRYPNELWLVLDDTLQAATEYTVTLKAGIESANGARTAETMTTTFNTRNTSTDSLISTIMMVGMMGLMIFMTSRAAKKKQEEEAVLTVAQAEKLNPYKIAKAKGWKLEVAEEYVKREKEKARKAEERILELKRQKEEMAAAELAEIEAEVDSEERRNGWFRVKAKGSFVSHGHAVPKYVKKKNAAKRKAAEERAKKYAKNKKKK